MELLLKSLRFDIVGVIVGENVYTHFLSIVTPFQRMIGLRGLCQICESRIASSETASVSPMCLCLPTLYPSPQYWSYLKKTSLPCPLGKASMQPSRIRIGCFPSLGPVKQTRNTEVNNSDGPHPRAVSDSLPSESAAWLSACALSVPYLVGGYGGMWVRIIDWVRVERTSGLKYRTSVKKSSRMISVHLFP